MPYPPEHKVQTRARIVESARRLFNRHGFEQVTIDQIMASAGLTRGAFYHHFDSKDELYAAAVASFVTCNPFAVKTAHAAQAIDQPVCHLFLAGDSDDSAHLGMGFRLECSGA